MSARGGGGGMGVHACVRACLMTCVARVCVHVSLRACMSHGQENTFVGGNRDRLSVPQGNSLVWRCAPDGYLMGSLPGD